MTSNIAADDPPDRKSDCASDDRIYGQKTEKRLRMFGAAEHAIEIDRVPVVKIQGQSECRNRETQRTERQAPTRATPVAAATIQRNR